MKKIYLACPYSHEDPDVRERRVLMADKATAWIMSDGFVVYSPLSHSHRVARHLDNHLDHVFWLNQCASFVEWADELWVLTLDGWKESKGIRVETGMAHRLGKPVVHIPERFTEGC